MSEYDLMTAQPSLFYGEDGELPITAVIATDRRSSNACLAGFARALELLKDIKPPPIITVQACASVVSPEGDEYETSENIIVIILHYSEETSRAIQIEFTTDHVTIH